MHYTGLAIIHHLLAFGLVIMLAMELAYLRGDTVPVTRLTGLDVGYGGVAVLVFLVGAARVVWGEKGWDFYQANPFFWAKIITFSAIGLLSITPTIAFIRWARAARADPAFQPRPAEVHRIAGLVRIEVLLLLPLAALAAAMARWTA